MRRSDGSFSSTVGDDAYGEILKVGNKVVINWLATCLTLAVILFLPACRLNSHPEATESEAIIAIRLLIKLQAEHRRAEGKFASLEELQDFAGTNDTDFSIVRNCGFQFSLRAKPDSYTISAKPTQSSNSSRSFYADESGSIRHAFLPDRASAHSTVLK
ncbi:MAG: hypothetical protein H7039_00180 [Bryobacteraceae bacterium]|nr:hypothetical protein [Bryobacteraceae bacterium]